MLKTESNKISLFAVLLLFVALLAVFPWTGKWHVIAWDTFGYYIYLPEFFIFHHSDISNYNQMLQLVNQYEISSTFYQVHPHSNGNFLSQYPIGMAILYLPAFLIGHLIALLGGFPVDGLSKPYEYALLLEHFGMVLLGTLLFRKIFLQFFSDKVTATLIVLLVAGTNFLHQEYWAIPSLHIYLFTLYCFFILQVIRWHHKPTRLNGWLMGAALGLITICRASDLIAILIPITWGIASIEDVKQKFKLIFGKGLLPFLFIIIGFALAVSPQLIFWKKFTGEWIYYSYKNAGEGFDFLEPNTFNFLLSYRKGWFVYTPLMLFILPGLYVVWKEKRTLFLTLLVFLIADVYLLSSWSCWWYAGGFGQRSMVQTYGLLMLPIGYFINTYFFTSTLKSKVLYLVLAFFVMLNIFQTWQAMKHILHPSQITKEYYWAVFGKTSIPEGAQKLLLVRRNAEGTDAFKDSTNYLKHIDRVTDFETPDEFITAQIASDFGNHSSHSLMLSDSIPFSQVIKIPFNELTNNSDHAWIRIRFNYYTNSPPEELLPTAVLSFLNQKGETYDYNGVKVENTEKTTVLGKWNQFEYTFLTPEVRSAKDNLSFYFWIRGKGALFVDDIEIQSFVKK